MREPLSEKTLPVAKSDEGFRGGFRLLGAVDVGA
jgi:hypothetical protein